VKALFKGPCFILFSLLPAIIFYASDVSAEKGGFPIPSGESCVSASCHADMAKKRYVHEAAPDGFSCTECHGMTNEAVHAFKLVAEGVALCYECHEDKATWQHVHSPVEEEECTSCHNPHQSDFDKLLVQDPSELCYECHDPKNTMKNVHSPVQEGECTGCHSPHSSSNKFQLLDTLPQLCFSCHDEDIVKGKFVHPPVEEGECTSCHNPHQSDYVYQLIDAIPGLCYGCHDEEDFSGTTPHGPVTEGECLECHKPHSSDHPSLLELPQPGLCLECHSDEISDPEGKTLPSAKEPYDKDMNLHEPFAGGVCTECHFPHPSDTFRLLLNDYPPQFYASYSDKAYTFCLYCHDDFESALSEPRTLIVTNFRNGDLNLHYRHVNSDKGRSCRACHHHHGSKNQKLIRQNFTFGKRNLKMRYKKTETGGTCSPPCHVPLQYDRDVYINHGMKVSPREGRDAAGEELRGEDQGTSGDITK
jgi:predicted CXXCH cytochrome family protein